MRLVATSDTANHSSFTPFLIRHKQLDKRQVRRQVPCCTMSDIRNLGTLLKKLLKSSEIRTLHSKIPDSCSGKLSKRVATASVARASTERNVLLNSSRMICDANASDTQSKGACLCSTMVAVDLRHLSITFQTSTTCW
jgi:hypothetical protein